jgi:predicted secreted protein
MTNFKLISAAAILSAAIATPAFAQEAAQEPGLQAFYQSLGVGSRSSATASAMASVRSGSNASVPVRRISAKHYTSDHKM